MRRYVVTALISAAAIVVPAVVHAQSTGLDDLVGARAGQAEGELERRGYVKSGGSQGDDRSYANWWSADRRQCVTIATADGRYVSVTPTPAPDCGTAPSRTRRNRSRSDDAPRTTGSTAPGDLPRLCKGEAAAAFNRRPGEITTNLPIRRSEGATVSGWFDGDRGTTFFTCRFDQAGRFVSVN
ncbi:hypothetical protein KZ820_17980 [Sphingomonas sp. RRHST34]|uniref:Uncharacterized protein n=1 Tax=Sphingomonas citri TaxID=2862499 RepID=A0ABS7BSP6_9SPHN|nr:hypothetical protein [Sphingomonas citri]MBW6532635.1 hypothetical protein [Sphingomonas citri]